MQTSIGHWFTLEDLVGVLAVDSHNGAFAGLGNGNSLYCAIFKRDAKLIARSEVLWLKPLGKPHWLVERHNLAIVVVLRPAIVIFEARQLPFFPIGGLLCLGVFFFK